MVGETSETVGAGVGGNASNTKMPTLEEYGTNLTKLAEDVGLFSTLFSHCELFKKIWLCRGNLIQWLEGNLRLKESPKFLEDEQRTTPASLVSLELEKLPLQRVWPRESPVEMCLKPLKEKRSTMLPLFLPHVTIHLFLLL